jgi:hypothetical protein
VAQKSPPTESAIPALPPAVLWQTGKPH